MYDIIIAGGGPAGMAAAVYAARKRLNILLVSANIGGQVLSTSGIENYLGYQFVEGTELIDKFESQVRQFPIDQKIGERVAHVSKVEGSFRVETESGSKFQAKTMVFATGKHPRRLNIPGEQELVGRGVSYCAVCDGPVFSEQRVAIIGGGNSALEATLDMLRIANHVELVSFGSLTADQVLIDRALSAKNLTVHIGYQAAEIKGKDSVQSLVIKNLQSGKLEEFEVAAVFVEVGLTPNSAPVKDIVRLNELGEVIITCACETSVPGLYAAGDVTNVPEKQIIIAAGEGAKAALQAHRYLQRMK